MNASRTLGPRSTRHAGRRSTQQPDVPPGRAAEEPSRQEPEPTRRDLPSLEPLLEIDGAVVAAVVDGSTARPVRAGGDVAAVDPEIVAAATADVFRSQLRMMQALDLAPVIHDVVVSSGEHYYVSRCLHQAEGFFVVLVLDLSRANLAMARHRLAAFADRAER